MLTVVFFAMDVKIFSSESFKNTVSPTLNRVPFVLYIFQSFMEMIGKVFG